MTQTAKKFCWVELHATDLDAAQTFYQKVLNWSVQDSGLSDRTYRILSAGSVGIGGMMTLPEESAKKGGRPAWFGYILSDDVEADLVRLQQAGGVVHRPAEDLPNIGCFAVVADPQGAVFVLFKPAHAGVPEQHSAPGTVGWRELHAVDSVKASDFYSSFFGWTKGDAIDMGPMGLYQLFKTGDEAAAGGMMKTMPDHPHPFWLYYFNTDALDATIARVLEGGGKVINGPHQVPTGQWIAVCFDPQGAAFALVASKR